MPDRSGFRGKKTRNPPPGSTALVLSTVRVLPTALVLSVRGGVETSLSGQSSAAASAKESERRE